MRTVNVRNSLRALALAVFALGVFAVPAHAAQSWGVTMANFPETLPRTDESMEYTVTATNTGDAPTIGPVSLDMTMPGGADTLVSKVAGTGWSCETRQPIGSEPAKVHCQREDSLVASASFPALTIVTELGEFAPEPTGTAIATVSGGGASSPASDEAIYIFTAGQPFGVIDGSFTAAVTATPSAIAEKTTISSVGAGTIELSKAATASGRQLLFAGPQPFNVGEGISGPGIPPGTTITGVGAQLLQLSAETTKESMNAPIESSGGVTATAALRRSKDAILVVTTRGIGTTTVGSKVATQVSTTKGSFVAGQGITGRGADYTTAGGHPITAATSFGFYVHHTIDEYHVIVTDNAKDIVVDAPRGFVGNALASPELCESVEAVMLDLCPLKSAVGGIEIASFTATAPISNPYPEKFIYKTAIFSIEPEYGRPAQFGFAANGLTHSPYTFVPELRADEGYAVSFRTAPIISKPPLFGTNVTLCGFGANFIKGSLFAESKFNGCKSPTDATANPQPLITNPTRCSGPPPATEVKVDSYQHPSEIKTYEFSAPPITDCEGVLFSPEAELQPTNHEADTPTGLGVEINMDTSGALSNTGISQANLDNVAVTLPEGMSINPATADGLQACSLAQIKLKSNEPEECPEGSRVGQIEIDTPLIRETLKGSIYVARQRENPFNSTLGLYMSFYSPRDGVRIKVAGQVETDPVTGQLTSHFTENPEAPFSRLALHFNEGPRAPLINPPRCGTYKIHAEFSPWSAVNPANPTPAESVSQNSTYEVTSGPNGSACPSGVLTPKMKAGLEGTQAGAKSPFKLTLTREDGTQRFTGIDVSTPKGLTAYLKGIPDCPDATVAAISGEELTGATEKANPSCPAASQVGTVLAGAGSGPYLFQAPGKVYLAGPYKGAPVSLAVVTPALAGPFDLGTVVIRNALHVDPVTAQVTAASDPIPTILHGILLDIRQIRLNLDRPGFTAAPTNCEPMAVSATVSGEAGATAALSNRFQASGCEALGFRPELNLRLFGGTHRGSHPKLRAVLTPRPGDANVASASVALPHSEFLDQAHIKTICTRVQFKANQCPPASIYGFAEATTPLLDSPLSGPVYLRSSDNPLPDLVASLRGPDSRPIEVQVAARIDSVNGGIRSTFEAVPDQPVSSFTLIMQGGRKGLLVNSRNLCKGKAQRVNGVFTAQNGRAATLRPKLQNACGKQGKSKKGPKRHRRRHQH